MPRPVKGGASDRASLAAALPKVSYTGPRGPLKIDPATNNIVQNIYIYETVAAMAWLTQKILDTIPDVAGRRRTAARCNPAI